MASKHYALIDKSVVLPVVLSPPPPVTQAALPHLKEGSSIINTSSITAYKGSGKLVDYSATKGAQVGRCIGVCTELNRGGHCTAK